MIDRFDNVLRELSVEYSFTLFPDKIGACRLKLEDKFELQLECDPYQENLLVATSICEIHPGKFRENTLRDALKANGPFPQNGTLAYTDRNNQLVLFTYLPFEGLTGRKLAEFFPIFLEKANSWRIGIEAGQTSHLVSPSSKPLANIFDIKPIGP